MKSKKISVYKRLINAYRAWQIERQEKILNTMVVYSFDTAVRLANKKRDLINHTVWVVAGSGLFLVFARYQRKLLQTQGFLKPKITSKDLNELASYVAFPYTAKDKRRGGIIRKFGSNLK